jgi:hypothetical protein
VSEITDIIVCVAEEVYIGIRLIVNGVEQVFRAVIKTLEDAVSAIGSFFLKLGKAIMQVVEALSVFLRWDKILATHDMIKKHLNDSLQKLPSQLMDHSKNVAHYFDNEKVSIKLSFAGFGKNPDNQKTINGHKQDPNPHNAFQAKGQSHAVQCTYMMHKVYQNAAGAKPPAAGQQHLGDEPDDPFLAAIQGVINGLETDIERVGTDIGKMFQAQSASEFFNLNSAIGLWEFDCKALIW